MEVWKTVPSFPFFEVSSLGRIRSKTRKTLSRNKNGPMTATVNGRVLKGWRNPKTGYTNVMVAEYDTAGHRVRQFPRGLHILVCEAFNGPRPHCKDVAAHRDGNPENNRPDNLYWATYSENEADKRRHGRGPSRERHPKATLSEADVVWIKRYYQPRSKTYGATALGNKFGVHRTTIENIVSGRTWGPT